MYAVSRSERTVGLVCADWCASLSHKRPGLPNGIPDRRLLTQTGRAAVASDITFVGSLAWPNGRNARRESND